MNSHVKYDRHLQGWNQIDEDPTQRELADTWLQEDTLDAWRHTRMRAPLKSVVTSDPDASWLTVGDGRFGTDGHALLRMGAHNVHCSDITDKLLSESKAAGFIMDCSAQNAEALSFADDSFDYVYCKESLHHFPRPYVALDEMFRVARKAVFLTEPRDPFVDRAPFFWMFTLAKRLLGRGLGKHDFEAVGNYVYRTSEHELEKFLLGLHHTKVAYIGCSDAYIDGISFVKLSSTSASDRRAIRKIGRAIRSRDVVSAMGFRESDILSAALFKTDPAAQTQSSMEASGWKFRNLPRNPYLDSAQS